MSFPTIENGCNPEVAVYRVDTAKQFPIGTKMVLEDGRTYRYCSAGGTCLPYCGAYKAKKTNTCTTAPTQATAAAQLAAYGDTLAAGAIGSRYVTVTIDTEIGHLTTGVLTADEMKGGFIVVGNGANQYPQMRRIVSHPALATAGGSLTMKLDGALITAVTAGTTTIEFMENPYSHLVADLVGSAYVSFIGVPACIAADGEFFWMQTKGPCWITSNSNTCNAAGDRTIVFASNGSVVSSDDVTVESGLQIAGYALDMSGSAESNAPFVMLQLE